MAVTHKNNKINTNGLAFYHDAANSKSFKGKPTKNYMTENTPDFVNWNNQDLVTQDLGGGIRKIYSTSRVSFSAIRWGVPFGVDATSTVKLTFSFKARGVGNARAQVHQANSSPGTTSHALINGPLYKLHKTEWKTLHVSYYLAGVTSQNVLVTLDAGAENYVEVKEAQVEFGDYYTPYVLGTRAEANILGDIMGNASVVPQALVYNSENYEFNGTNTSFLATFANPFPLYNIDLWFYNYNYVPKEVSIGGPSQYQTLVTFNEHNTSGIALGGWTGGATDEAFHIWSDNGTSYDGMTYNRQDALVGWHNLVFNWNGSSYDIWLDGIKTPAYHHTTVGQANLTTISSIRIGRNNQNTYFFNGKLGSCKAYSVPQADSNVLENFESQRKRFGL